MSSDIRRDGSRYAANSFFFASALLFCSENPGSNPKQTRTCSSFLLIDRAIFFTIRLSGQQPRRRLQSSRLLRHLRISRLYIKRADRLVVHTSLKATTENTEKSKNIVIFIFKGALDTSGAP